MLPPDPIPTAQPVPAMSMAVSVFDASAVMSSIRMAEMLATLEGVAFSGRMSMHDVKHVLKAKKLIRRAFGMQVNDMGLAFVELLSACHTNWHVSPLEGQKKVEEELIPYFPLGVFKERSEKDFL